jgi:hypothetical protein
MARFAHLPGLTMRVALLLVRPPLAAIAAELSGARRNRPSMAAADQPIAHVL